MILFKLLLLLLSHFSRVRLVATLWTAAYQAPLSMGFSRQEYWSWVPLPSPNISHEENANKKIMKNEIGVFVLGLLEYVTSSLGTLSIPRIGTKLSEDAAHKILLLSKFPRTDNVRFPINLCHH